MVERLVLARAFLLALRMGGRERQMVLPLLRLHGLRGEWKVDFVDSRTRLGNAQTSLALHSLLPRFCGCAWNGGLVLSAPAFLIENSNE